MHINLIAVLVAVVAGMIVGALWYGPLFGRSWRAAAGPRARPQAGQPGLVYGGTLVATAVTVTILAALAAVVATGLGLALLPAALLTAHRSVAVRILRAAADQSAVRGKLSAAVRDQHRT